MNNPNRKLAIIREFEKKAPIPMTYAIPLSRQELSEKNGALVNTRDEYFVDEMSQLIGRRCPVLCYELSHSGHLILALLDGGEHDDWYFPVCICTLVTYNESERQREFSSVERLTLDNT